MKNNRKQLQEFQRKLRENIRVCKRFQETSEREGRDQEAIKMFGMIEAYTKSIWIAERIFSSLEEKSSL